MHFVGVVDDIADYYRAADLFVLTSEREGMNNAFFEAMASGLPVLTVRFQGLSAAHGRPGTHYELATDEPEALGRAIDDLLVHEPHRKDLSRQGREWALAEADVERVLDRYAALYRNLAGKRA